jgi:charged multivesicular body protein 4A/B
MPFTTISNLVVCRDDLREQNALSGEIVEAMNNVTIGVPVEESDLDAEVEELQQEQLDEQMLKTGTVPVSNTIQSLPAVAKKERKLSLPVSVPTCLPTTRPISS